MSTIAARLRGLREQAAFSQQKLSKTLNVAQASLCRYECGETEAPASVLLKYADFFDVSLDYIFGRTDDPHGKSFDCKPRYSDPEWEQFIEMCFDPKSPMNARLKQSLKDMMREENKNAGERLDSAF